MHAHNGSLFQNTKKLTLSSSLVLFNHIVPFKKFTRSPYVILIEATAGIGKSTLRNEIALKWANKNY